MLILFLNKKSERFVKEHSCAIQKLNVLNYNYIFHDVPNLDLRHNYDNSTYFDKISPLDFLTYKLPSMEQRIKQAVSSADRNKQLYEAYTNEVLSIDNFGTFNKHGFISLFRSKLQKKENKAFKMLIKKPTITFEIKVTLYQTNMRGCTKDKKEDFFNIKDITPLLERLKNKNGDFYVDKEIWESICRVERGKVSNKIRFAVYDRDNHRCIRCGAKQDLEIDHVFPISKGGKTTLNNLQTLCRNCNMKKSNTIESNYNLPSNVLYDRVLTCKICNAPLTLRKGIYGKFYGCSNFPKCKFTMNFDDETNKNQ